MQVKRDSAADERDSGESGEGKAVQWTPLVACKQDPRTLKLLRELL